MRVLLFVLMQAAVLAVVGIAGSIIMALFGIRPNAASYAGMFVFCAIMGCAGSIISLFMSKSMCIAAYGVRIIEQPSNRAEAFLVNEVAMLAQRAGMKMPQVGIYDSPDPNAFATGASKDNALVAVSSGLLNNMTPNEIRGVLGHEIAHIDNGDMVTMTLLQGVLNTFVYFLSYVVANVLTSNRNSEEGTSSAGFFAHFIVRTVLELLFGIAATLIAMWFSRYREYRADAGSVRLTGNVNDMIAALQALQRISNRGRADARETQFSAFQINSSSLTSLFSTHPSLESRIAALRGGSY